MYVYVCRFVLRKENLTVKMVYVVAALTPLRVTIKIETCTALAIANFFSMLSVHRLLYSVSDSISFSLLLLVHFYYFFLFRHLIDLFIPFANAMQKMSPMLLLLLLLYLAGSSELKNRRQ